jgi:hypothetical protein
MRYKSMLDQRKGRLRLKLLKGGGNSTRDPCELDLRTFGPAGYEEALPHRAGIAPGHCAQ